VVGGLNCGLCDEPILDGEPLSPTHGLVMHQECGLREVIGGIGHLIDHARYCRELHDPDGGFTYRQSARLVQMWVEIHGVEAAADRG
jgi:hypothetical protein